MKVLVDTNVILDVLLNRVPFVELSANIVSAVETRDIEGYLCATTVSTLDYLISKAKNRQQAKVEIKKLLHMFGISEVNARVLELAAESEFTDFEDAVLYYSGECAGVDCLVTRNVKDFKQASLPVYTPEELWGILLIKQKR